MNTQLQHKQCNSSSRRNQINQKEHTNSQHFLIHSTVCKEWKFNAISSNKIQIEKKQGKDILQNFNLSLQIFISSPNNAARKFAVIPNDPLLILNSIFPGDKKVYFYNGQILEPKYSFNYYGITNEDRIVTVPFEQINFQSELFWRKVTKNSMNDQERFIITNDVEAKRFVSKNSD
jgi:hypothetical protein